MPIKRKRKIAQRNAMAAKKKSQMKRDVPASIIIRSAIQAGRSWLHLEKLNLTEVPEEIYQLKSLRYLDLSSNNIESIPDRLWIELPDLQRVSVVNNPIKILPERPGIVCDAKTYLNLVTTSTTNDIEVFIENNVELETVDKFIQFCSNNRPPKSLALGKATITLGESRNIEPSEGTQMLLDSISTFKDLEALSVRGIYLRELPKGIRALKSLKTLRLDAVGLTEFPNWISELPLNHLSALVNKIQKLPNSFSNLKNLVHLNLSWNGELKEIPEEVFEISTLRWLSFEKCKISRVSRKLLQLQNLEFLRLTENPIEDPPLEVAVKGVDAIRNYWRQREDSGVDYLCEAKLIILGEPGAGKTSLAHKIVDNNYILLDSQKSTEGIDVLKYQFPTGIRTNFQGNGKFLQRKFQVNIWDFGGQEIYHATHQFFLTRRSVYILVCDDRKEDTDFSYWLNIVQMLSNGSPLIIVQNEKQDRTRDINISSLRAQFHNLKGSFRTNLDNNRGLELIVQTIQKELEHLPHIGAGLPATWKRVREALEKDERDFIGLEEYFGICQKHGFTQPKDKLQLSEYLHDLGICLHFQDDAILKNIIILKPSWGTDAVYRILDDPKVIEARGRFSSAELSRIWSEEKYEGMHHELLKLMTKFQLCYALEGQSTYIAPQLLSSEPPQYSWQQSGGLIVRYHYKFLPKGIITRFIVEMHHLISKGTVWKTGVVLERDESRIEITEDYSQRRITVRAVGPNRHGLLAIVDEQLDRIHRTFHGLEYEKYLPCQCKECKEKIEPYGFPLEALIRISKIGRDIQCHNSTEMIDARKLVQEILPRAFNKIDQQEESEITVMEKESAEKLPGEVFVSYAWTNESKSLVDKLQKVLDENGVRLLRDSDELNYKDSIRNFMQRLGKGKCIIAIISEKYLKSENCMFELLEISKAQKFKERIFPIILTDANIYKPLGRVSYVKYWEQQIQELDDALKSLQGQDLSNLQQDLNLYAEIRRSFDSISHTLRDMNALTSSIHEESDFEQLIKKIQLQLAE